MTIPRILPVLLPVLLVAASLTATAQTDHPFSQRDTPAQPPIQTLTLSTRLVLLDTAVTDPQGKPVLGLTAKDFQVFEDKTEQRIISFDTPVNHTLPPTSTIQTVFDPANPTPFAQSPVNLLVLDEVNTHFSDTAYGVHSLIEYLRARPATLAQPTAVLAVHDSHFDQLADFTLDRDHLIAVLKAHVPEQAWQLEQSMSAGEGVGVRLDLSLSALEQIVQHTARIPGHKNIIWVGAGFPSVDPAALTLGTNLALQHMLQHVTDVLLDARASLYAIDPTTTLPTNTEITDPIQLAFASAAGGGARMLDPFDRTLDFDRLGPVTGGRVIRGNNGIANLVDQAVTTGSLYYTIGYRPTNASLEPGKFRKIRIVCLRPGLTATTHDGYYTSDSPTSLTADTIGYDLNNAVTAAIPFLAIAFTADPTPARPAAPGDFTLHARASDLTWRHTPGDPDQKSTVEVLIAALTDKNKILAHTLNTETATTPVTTDTRSPDQRVRFATTLPNPLPPKTTHLRLVIRDQSTGRMGTLDLPLHP